MAIVDETEYKGNPMLVLKGSEDDRWPFQFGLKKAKLVIEHIEDIQKVYLRNTIRETRRRILRNR